MILWSEEKDRWLRQTRGVSFAEISSRILEEDYLDLIEHPGRENQQLFVLKIHYYTWAVPFVINKEEGTLFLKTAYPSRKLHKRYGRR